MKVEKACSEIRRAAKAAKAVGVKAQFIVTSDDYNRPLKTADGAIKKLQMVNRCGFWLHWRRVSILFAGANGKTYKTPGRAASASFGGK